METYRSEEEQVEALRKWWDENGRSTLVAIVVALAVGFGWQGWQEHRVQQSELASARYEEMLEAARAGGDEAQVATLRHLAEGIKADFPGSSYAQFAALHLARLAIEEGDLAAGEEELRWVLTNNPATEIQLIAELRLARVTAARGNPQGGLEIIAAAEAGAYKPAFAEAEGDMYQQLGEPGKAIEAYERSAALGMGTNETLQLKLRSLTPVPARAPAAEPEE